MQDQPLSYQELRDGLQIDKHRLDAAIAMQPTLYQIVGEQVALALSRADAAYENVKVVDARLALSIREGGEKLTEAAVSAKVLATPEHTAAVQASNDARRIHGEWVSLKEAYAQRAYALRDMVSLFTSSYFQNSSVAATNEQSKEMRAAVIRAAQGDMRN